MFHLAHATLFAGLAAAALSTTAAEIDDPTLDPEARDALLRRREEEAAARRARRAAERAAMQEREAARRAAMTPEARRYEDARRGDGYVPHQSARERARAAKRIEKERKKLMRSVRPAPTR